MPDDRWRGIRYRTIENSGQLWSTNLRLAFLELVSLTQPQTVAIYDSFSTPQNLITRLSVTSGRVSWPPKNVTVPIERGLYVSFSQSALLTGTVTLGWFPSGRSET